MPMFSSIRDSRGRFVGHEATTQLARSFEAGLNGNPGEWQRAQEILHRLGWDQFSFMRKYGSQIPFRPSMAVAPPPPGAGHQSGSQSNAQVVMFYKDIHSMSSDIHNILKMQQRVGGGGGGAPPPPWTHYTTPGPWGGLHIGATRGRMPTGGGAGGGGGWFGGGGGFAGGGGGFGAGALRGMLPPGFRRLAGEAGAGFVGFELLKAMINPVGFGFENIIHPLATASKRAWDFRRTMFGAAGPGGDPSAFTARIAPGLMPSLGIGRDATLPTWMHQLGMGPEDALSLAGQYGIRGRSPDENVRNLQMLGAAREGLTDRFQGFRGMDPASIVSMARTGMARGLGGRGELANSTFLDSFSETMKTAYAEGADRATVFAHMEESLQMLSRAGATGISGTSLNALFDIMLKSGLPGGRTGEAAQAMVGGTLGAIQTIGQDTRRSIVASMLYSKYGGDLEKMVGPDVMKNLNPVQAKALAEAKDLAKRGAVIPAFELLAKGVLSSDTGVLRWQQLSKEGAQLAMPNIPGMRTLFGAGTAGVNVGDWLGAQIGAGRMTDPDEMLNMIMQYESQGQNINNFKYSTDPKKYSASGYWQILDSTWKRYASKVPGASNFSRAIDAPYDIQRGVASAILAAEGPSPWANYNPRLASALGGVTGGFDIGNSFSPAGGGLPAGFGNLVPGIPAHTFESMAASQGAGLTASAGWSDAFTIAAFAKEIGEASKAVEAFVQVLGAGIRASQSALGIQPAPVVTPKTTEP